MMRIDPRTHILLDDAAPKVFIPAGKGGKAHWKPLTPVGVVAFRLFTVSGANGRFSTSSFYKSWMKACDDAQVEWRTCKSFSDTSLRRQRSDTKQ